MTWRKKTDDTSNPWEFELNFVYNPRQHHTTTCKWKYILQNGPKTTLKMMCHANNRLESRLRFHSNDVRQCQIWISFVLCYAFIHIRIWLVVFFFISCSFFTFHAGFGCFHFSIHSFSPSHLNSTITFYLAFGSIVGSDFRPCIVYSVYRKKIYEKI